MQDEIGETAGMIYRAFVNNGAFDLAKNKK